MASFLERAPLLFYALLFTLGSGAALAFHLSYLIPIALLCLSYRPAVALCVALLGFAWASLSYQFPKIGEEGVEGRGIFKIDSLSYITSPFQRSLCFKGFLREFHTNDRKWKNVPCQIYFSKNKIPPQADRDLQVTGKLLLKEKHRYLLKLQQAHPVLHSYSHAQWRFDLKNRIGNFFRKQFSEPKSCAFLFSMLTGEANDRLLSLEFNRLGLLHLIGISGFQFSLLAYLLNFLSRFFLSYSKGCLVVMLLLSMYAFALGSSPPIERAWVALVLYLIALLLGYQATPINFLGAALFYSLLREPLYLFHLGFQFTFLCTLAILITYPACQSLFSCLSPRRTFKEVTQMSLLDQQGYLLSFFFRESLALNLSIHLVTLPLILYQFHKFPLLSLVYNLFLPSVASLIYGLLIVGMIMSLVIPHLGALINRITEGLTIFTLKLASYPPVLYDFQWRTPCFSMTVMVITLTVIITLSIFRSHKLSHIATRPFR